MTQETTFDFPWDDDSLITGISVKFWSVYDRSTHSFSLVKARLMALKLHLLFSHWREGQRVERKADVTVPVDHAWIDAADVKAIEDWAEHWFWTAGQRAMLERQEKLDAAVDKVHRLVEG